MTREEIIAHMNVMAQNSLSGGMLYVMTEKDLEVVRDAAALLKAQEPRVMTLVEALEADYVYLETRLHPNRLCDCCILAVDKDNGILALKRGFGGWLDGEEYGESWRCWTSRPTDEQRRKTPWN